MSNLSNQPGNLQVSNVSVESWNPESPVENLELPERVIVAAAVKLDGVVWQLPAPARHHHVLWALDQVLPGRAIEAHDQGFVTADGRYVDRTEGAKLALDGGQIGELRWPPSLYSEDLW